jgi:hypothetical protein
MSTKKSNALDNYTRRVQFATHDALSKCQAKTCKVQMEMMKELKIKLMKLMENKKMTEATFKASMKKYYDSKEFKDFQKCYAASCGRQLDAVLPHLLKTFERECKEMGVEKSCETHASLLGTMAPNKAARIGAVKIVGKQLTPIT